MSTATAGRRPPAQTARLCCADAVGNPDFCRSKKVAGRPNRAADFVAPNIHSVMPRKT